MEEAARRNRERMPKTAEEVDRWRAVFGPVKVLWAQEGVVEVGRRGPPGVPLSEWKPPEDVAGAGRAGR